jgi:uncharacterized membrane protein YcjF (UPF0283 family)
MTAIDGISYTLFGDSIAQGSSYSVIDAAFPGSIRSFGAVMVLLSVSLLIGLWKNRQWVQYTLLAVFAFGLLLIAEVIGGWILDGHVEISAVTKWFLVSWLALWLTTQRAYKR